MKSPLFGSLALALFTCVSASSSFAAATALDNASDPTYDSGWANLSNGGSGFGAWSFVLTGSNTGTFLGSSQGNGFSDGNIDTTLPPGGGASSSPRSWGAFANSSSYFDAYRPFAIGGANSSNILGVSQEFSIAMDNGFIDGGTVGFGLQNSSGDDRIELYFTGGSSDYTLSVSGSTFDTNIPFTTKGLTAVFAQGAGNSWSLAITPNGGSAANFSDVSTGVSLAQSDISQVHLFNANAGPNSDHDAFFNSIQVADVPEPSAYALLGASLLGVIFARRFAGGTRFLCRR